MIARAPSGVGASASGWLLLALACRAGDGAAGIRRAAPAAEGASTAVTASAAVSASATAPAASSARTRSLTLTSFSESQVCTSLGALRPSGSGLFRVDDPKLRAILAGSHGHGIELAFRYLGPTATTERLRSGSDRRQLGLELLARDTCNLVYVMWRIEPTSELVVSVKRNGAQSTHSQCENRGYHRLRPSVSSPLPELVPGAEHELRAEIARGTLSVHVDGSLAWSGTLDAPGLELSGKSGLRSDNARFDVLALRADAPGDAREACDAARR
jgi:hypothetical protein